MSDPAQREWRFYITDMIGFAEKVVAYADGMDQERFVASGLNYDATVHNLVMAGEAATHIPEHVPHLCKRHCMAAGHRHTKPPDSRLSRHQG